MDPVEELALLLRPAGGGLYLVSTGADAQKTLQRRFYGKDSDADVTDAFHAALQRIPTAKAVLLGIPSDVGAGFRRGANLGPQGIRQALLEDDTALPPGSLDIGDVFVVPQLLDDEMLSPQQLATSRQALYPDVAHEVRRRLPVSPLSIAERVWQLVFTLNPAARPVSLGGDHSTAWPAVSALHRAGRKFCIVQFDAHTDLLPERLGVRICFATWSFHANELIGRQQRMLQVGIRATRHSQSHWEQTLGVRQWWAKDVNAAPSQALDDIVAAARATGLPCYVSNDIDGTDEAFADATGTPEPGGVSPEFVGQLITRLGAEIGLVGADVMEVAPGLAPDGGQRTSRLAASYLRQSVRALVQDPAIPRPTLG